MSERVVKTQAELDQAIADGVKWIEIRSPRGVWIDVYSYDSATVTAYGSATVRAYDSATVTAYGSATVTAYDSATVTAYDSATVTAYGSATVTAYDSATVRAYDSATVTAYGSATVRAYDSATVTAGSHTAVHLHSGRARVEGGVLIDHTQIDESTGEKWATYHGAEIQGDTITVFKAVRDDLRSAHGFLYEVGSTVTCDDWRDENECGNGLHFSPTPGQASAYDPDATRWLECLVPTAKVRPLTGGGTAKLKSPSAVVLREVDIAGRPIKTKAAAS